MQNNLCTYVNNFFLFNSCACICMLTTHTSNTFLSSEQALHVLLESAQLLGRHWQCTEDCVSQLKELGTLYLYHTHKYYGLLNTYRMWVNSLLKGSNSCWLGHFQLPDWCSNPALYGCIRGAHIHLLPHNMGCTPLQHIVKTNSLWSCTQELPILAVHSVTIQVNRSNFLKLFICQTLPLHIKQAPDRLDFVRWHFACRISYTLLAVGT